MYLTNRGLGGAITWPMNAYESRGGKVAQFRLAQLLRYQHLHLTQDKFYGSKTKPYLLLCKVFCNMNESLTI